MPMATIFYKRFLKMAGWLKSIRLMKFAPERLCELKVLTINEKFYTIS